MPKVTTLQTNFTAGEISPQLYGRVDVARYQNGVRSMRNTIPQIYGGGKRRPGTIFVREVKDSADPTRLIPFVLNATTAYIIEAGDLYMRFYKDNAVLGAPYEVVSPYSSASIFAVDYTHGEDTMFLFNEAVAPYKLVRIADTNWTLAAATFVNTPFEEPGSYPASTMTASAKDPVGATVTMTAGSAVLSAGLVGSSIKINGGIVKLTAYTSTTLMDGVIKQELTSTTAAPADAWSLHAPAWSGSRGYPRTGTLYEQRLIAAGSPTFPQTIWGSVTGAYLDFQQGVADDDCFAFKIASDNTNPIQYMAGGTSLLALTSGGEFTVQGGLEKPLAPTNARIKQRRNHGCAAVRPVSVLDSEMFVQRAGRKLRALGDNDGLDKWGAPDLSVLSEHLTAGGIVDMCWQQEPDSIIWLVREDGKLASVTYDRDQDVTAWALHDLGGIVESIACIPTADADQVWLVVRRTIDGDSVRYVERMSLDVRSDCALVLTGASATVWTGLGHLEGKAVDVVANGYYAGRKTVTGGQITLDRAATSIEVGLPYTSEIELLPPEIQTGMGSASGHAMSVSEVTVRFHETTGCKVRAAGETADELTFRQTGDDALDQPPTLFSGIKRIECLGWERGDAPLILSQDLPMPWHVLSVTRVLTVNSG
jgi:hypothetical protein